MKNVWFYLMFVSTLSVLLTACEPAQHVESGLDSQLSLQKPDIQFSIYSDSYRNNASRHVEVNLSERISEDGLAEVGRYIVSIERKDQYHNRTYIFYYVADQSRDMAWATTHFEPEIEVKVLGTSGDQYAALNEEKPNELAIQGEIISEWMVNAGISYRLIFHRTSESKHYLTSIHSDGSFGTDEVEVTRSRQGTKLQSERDKSFGEYVVIDGAGNLELWSESGKYHTARALD